MSNINERLTAGRIRFKRGWNRRPVGSTAAVADFGYGLCQTLVDTGKAEWIDEEAKAVPTVGAGAAAAVAAQEAPTESNHHRRRR